MKTEKIIALIQVILCKRVLCPPNLRQGTEAPLTPAKSSSSSCRSCSPLACFRLSPGHLGFFFVAVGYFSLLLFWGAAAPGLQEAGGRPALCRSPPAGGAGQPGGTAPPPFPAAGAQHGRAPRDKAGRCRGPPPPPGAAPRGRPALLAGLLPPAAAVGGGDGGTRTQARGQLQMEAGRGIGQG